MKVPKITIDPKSLKRGIWNNTWKNWGYILSAFLFLYAIEAGYFAGLLFASKRIRGQTFRALPSQYFGDFLRDANVYSFPFGQNIYFNPPEGCVEGEVTRDVQGVEITEPNGVQTCTPKKGGELAWVLFPWVKQTNAAGRYPGCAATDDTVITQEASPAFTGDGTAATQAVVCQNFVPAENATSL